MGLWSYGKIKLSGHYLNGFNRRHSPPEDYYPELLVDIFISRQFFFYFTRYYLPSFFVVIISFLPLYLAPNAHSKVGLGITVMLTMVTLVTGSYEHLPTVNYLTALDVYLFFCFFSVFLSVLEYALIGYFELVLEKAGDLARRAKLDRNEGGKCAGGGGDGEDKGRKAHLEKRRKTAKKWSLTVDYISRKVYPAFFGLFHLLYLVVLAVNAHQNWNVEIRHLQL